MGCSGRKRWSASGSGSRPYRDGGGASGARPDRGLAFQRGVRNDRPTLVEKNKNKHIVPECVCRLSCCPIFGHIVPENKRFLHRQSSDRDKVKSVLGEQKPQNPRENGTFRPTVFIAQKVLSHGVFCDPVRQSLSGASVCGSPLEKSGSPLEENCRFLGHHWKMAGSPLENGWVTTGKKWVTTGKNGSPLDKNCRFVGHHWKAPPQKLSVSGSPLESRASVYFSDVCSRPAPTMVHCRLSESESRVYPPYEETDAKQ